MPDTVQIIAGRRVLLCGVEGPLLATPDDANDVISAAWQHEASVVAMPVSRLAPAFFSLSTRLAGEAIQKFVNYQLLLAFIGDIGPHLERSEPLRAFVEETNKGRQLWFVRDHAELTARLERLR